MSSKFSCMGHLVGQSLAKHNEDIGGTIDLTVQQEYKHIVSVCTKDFYAQFVKDNSVLLRFAEVKVL